MTKGRVVVNGISESAVALTCAVDGGLARTRNRANEPTVTMYWDARTRDQQEKTAERSQSEELPSPLRRFIVFCETNPTSPQRLTGSGLTHEMGTPNPTIDEFFHRHSRAQANGYRRMLKT
jgi:hypothetical protein